MDNKLSKQLSKHNSYKKYRNIITELIRKANKLAIKNILRKIRKNLSSRKSKKDSSISNIIVDGNTITAPTEMAENFNNFFTSKGKNLQKNIPPTKKTFTDYLRAPNLDNQLYHRSYKCSR